jgi:hypothetical protein
MRIAVWVIMSLARGGLHVQITTCRPLVVFVALLFVLPGWQLSTLTGCGSVGLQRVFTRTIAANAVLVARCSRLS